MKSPQPFRILMLAVLMSLTSSTHADEPPLFKGQTLYLPIYSHVWHGDRNDRGHPLKNPFSVLISIRNTDLKYPIRVVSARYFDTTGKSLHEYVRAPRTIPPMGTHELYVERKDSAGGSGANFIITWEAATPANAPVVEAVHTDAQGNHTLSFITSARPIRTDN